MYIVAGTLLVDPAERADFLKAREPSIQATLTEPGCIDYSFSADGLVPGKIRVFEKWASKEALLTHLGVIQKATADAPPSPFKILGADFSQYEIASEGPIGS
jgi:quinol monooxygenase YgiN